MSIGNPRIKNDTLELAIAKHTSQETFVKSEVK